MQAIKRSMVIFPSLVINNNNRICNTTIRNVLSIQQSSLSSSLLVSQRWNSTTTATAAAATSSTSTPVLKLRDLRRTNASIQVPKPPKKAAKYLTKIKDRVEKIQANLAAQDKKIADYKKTLPPKPITQGLLYLIKKNAWDKD